MLLMFATVAQSSSRARSGYALKSGNAHSPPKEGYEATAKIDIRCNQPGCDRFLTVAHSAYLLARQMSGKRGFTCPVLSCTGQMLPARYEAKSKPTFRCDRHDCDKTTTMSQKSYDILISKKGKVTCSRL